MVSPTEKRPKWAFFMKKPDTPIKCIPSIKSWSWQWPSELSILAQAMAMPWLSWLWGHSHDHLILAMTMALFEHFGHCYVHLSILFMAMTLFVHLDHRHGHLFGHVLPHLAMVIAMAMFYRGPGTIYVYLFSFCTDSMLNESINSLINFIT